MSAGSGRRTRRRVELVTAQSRTPLTRGEDGWWTGGDRPGGRGALRFSLDGGEPRPDPRGLPCRTVRTAPRPGSTPAPSRGPTPAWTGVELAGSVIYETHVGTFTPEGTLDAAVGRLPHLVDLGVDVVELLPLSSFPGRHNWGYDGVAPYSVHETYGGPAALQRFVDAAHAHGLGVCLDVVYNHLGPDGNYLGEFGPYFTDLHARPGDRPSTWTGRTATRSAAGCSTTPCGGWATSTSTGCGSTPCTSCTTRARPTSWRSCPARSPRCPPTTGRRAVAGRRVRPQRPAARSRPAGRATSSPASAWTGSGSTTSTTRCTSR